MVTYFKTLVAGSFGYKEDFHLSLKNFPLEFVLLHLLRLHSQTVFFLTQKQQLLFYSTALDSRNYECLKVIHGRFFQTKFQSSIQCVWKKNGAFIQNRLQVSFNLTPSSVQKHPWILGVISKTLKDHLYL